MRFHQILCQSWRKIIKNIGHLSKEQAMSPKIWYLLAKQYFWFGHVTIILLILDRRRKQNLLIISWTISETFLFLLLEAINVWETLFCVWQDKQILFLTSRSRMFGNIPQSTLFNLSLTFGTYWQCLLSRYRSCAHFFNMIRS